MNQTEIREQLQRSEKFRQGETLSTGDVVNLCNKKITFSQASNALAAMVDEGVITKPKPGLWKIAQVSKKHPLQMPLRRRSNAKIGLPEPYTTWGLA